MNALAAETSPYLQQHADNPVQWYPWNAEALALARDSGKPILLSIGYSACHWCHVMAHESFEDPATAEVMNRLYVNIKVDREERPDLDRIYQNAFQLLNQRAGGWPLTVFLTPDDHVPFFAGTYFPPEPRHGMPSFRDVLEQVAAFYHQNHDEIAAQNERLLDALAGFNPQPSQAARIDATPLDQARQQLGAHYDRQYGGFGGAPKFPHPNNLERLLRHWAMTRDAGQADDTALEMVTNTLQAMAAGGIYDQLGGGFCRYAVDEHWSIPHFEKMLYDNGPLLHLYAAAWAATGTGLFRRIAEETGEWVLREMTSPEGGFWSTLDADSEGEEGRFYVWTPDEVRALLDADEYAVAARLWGLDQPANFEGKWHLRVMIAPADLSRELKRSPEDVLRLRESARRKLFAAREQRVHPGRDEKVLTAWNGLMIRGLASAGRLLGREDFIDAAARAVDFIRDHLYRDGRLVAGIKDGRVNPNRYLDDHVFLIDGLLELLQARFRPADLQLAIELADTVLADFQDELAGGFFFTPADHESLILRPKPIADDAIPAGNGIAAKVLLRLGHLLGETRYLEAAEATLNCAWSHLEQYASLHGALLDALEEYLHHPEIVVLRGDPAELPAWQTKLARPWQPRRLVLAIPTDAADLPGLLAQRPAPATGVTAWICRGTACEAPVRKLEDL